ncbi:unnamed protein product, partial [Polarella glacialis]
EVLLVLRPDILSHVQHLLPPLHGLVHIRDLHLGSLRRLGYPECDRTHRERRRDSIQAEDPDGYVQQRQLQGQPLRDDLRPWDSPDHHQCCRTSCCVRGGLDFVQARSHSLYRLVGEPRQFRVQKVPCHQLLVPEIASTGQYFFCNQAHGQGPPIPGLQRVQCMDE